MRSNCTQFCRFHNFEGLPGTVSQCPLPPLEVILASAQSLCFLQAGDATYRKFLINQNIEQMCQTTLGGLGTRLGVRGLFINRGRVQIVAGFAAIDTECLSIDAFVLLIATASRLSHSQLPRIIRVARAMSKRKSYDVSFKLKALSAQRRRPRKPLPPYTRGGL